MAYRLDNFQACFFYLYVTFFSNERPIGMESNYHTLKREDNQLLVITHLTQLITLITGFGSLLVPLILWVTQKDKVHQMDIHGKAILNFQLSLIVYSIVCIPLIFFLGLGLLGLIVLGIVSIVFPIVNAIKASNGELPRYPLSLNFVS